MSYYEVEIREILAKKVIVEGATAEEAKEKAENCWHLGQAFLSDRDFSHAEITPLAVRTEFSLGELCDNLIGGTKALKDALRQVEEEMGEGTPEDDDAASVYEVSEKISSYAERNRLRFDEKGRIIAREEAA